MGTTLSGVMKIAVAAALAAVLSGSLAFAIAGGPTLELYSSGTSFSTGDEITVEVRIDTKTYAATAAELHLSFPEGAFEVVSMREGTFLPIVLTSPSSTTNSSSITVGSGTSPRNGTGTIAVLVLRALRSGSHEVSFADTTLLAVSNEAGDVTDTKTPITFEVTGAEDTGGSGNGSGNGSVSGSYRPICAPASTSGLLGQEIRFSVANPEGDHSWTAIGGIVTGGCSAAVGHQCLNVRFDEPGFYEVEVTSTTSGLSSVCDVSVTTSGIPTESPSSMIGEAGSVETGPGEVAVISLILASIAAVAYVGYTSTDWFRRREAGDIVDQTEGEKDRGDFKS